MSAKKVSVPREEKESTPRRTKWMDAIQKLLNKKGKSIAQFSEEIGKGQNYNQVYSWLQERSHEPKAEVMLRMVDWALREDPALIRLFGKQFSSLNG